MDKKELDELESLFRQLSRQASQEWGKQQERGLSHSHVFILKNLKIDGPLRVSELAERLYMTPGAITGLSDKLILSGYAVRKRSEDDRRVVFLEITPAGEEILQSSRERMRSFFSHMFDGLPDQDVRHLVRIYKSILSNLETSSQWNEDGGKQDGSSKQTK